MKLNETITLDSLKHHAPQLKTPEQQLNDAIASAGLDTPNHIIFDGELHRFSSNGKAGDKSGWYVAFGGDIYAAAFGCWRRDLLSNWRMDMGRSFTMLEEMAYKTKMQAAKLKRDAELHDKHESAKETAKELLISSSEASNNHPYLIKKGIQSHGARISPDGRLMIPMALDGHDDIVSLQYIGTSKHFLSGGAVKGAWWHIGKLQGGASKVFIAEGFATAATIYEQTGIPCAIAFSAGNIKSTAISLRDLVGMSCSITICADRDESGIGEKSANEAAITIGAKVIVSPASSDFNDAVKEGIDIVSILMPQQANDFLMSLADFCHKPSPIKWLIKKWVQKEGLCMVHGPSGCGKTFVVIDWMCRIASNISNWGDSTVADGVVIYLAGEGHQGLRGRFEAWSRTFYGGNTAGINIFVSKEGCDLNTPVGYQRARDAILSTKQQPVCIVIDTLHRFLMGDENSAQDAKTMLDACAALQNEFKSTVILIHHTGVNEDAQHRARGSSAWKGALETEISVKQNKDKTIEIISRKAKDSEPPKPKLFNLMSVVLDGWDDEDGDIYSSAVIIESEIEYTEKVNSEVETAKNEFLAMVKCIGLEKLDCFAIKEGDWKMYLMDKLNKSESAAIKDKQRNKKVLMQHGVITESEGYYLIPKWEV